MSGLAGSLDLLTVPTIDLTGWAGGEPTARAAIAAELDHACRTVGFMQIVGHGIPDSAVHDLTEAMDEFFGLPLEVKCRSIAPRASINRGYTVPGSEKLSYSLGVDSPADMFEAFNIGASTADFPDLDLDPEIYAADIWPENNARFRDGAVGWFRHAAALARTMTDVFTVALGLPDGYFRPFTDHSIDVLRMVNYALPEGTDLEPDQLGMGAHTDYGIVTILWADPVPGLQVLDSVGVWHPVVPAPGALLVNLGDLLARWTNDRWTSTMHRVVPPTGPDGRSMRRRSAAFFHDGNADALISTLTPCRSAEGTGYDDVTIAEHLAQKLAGSRGLELNDHASREAARIAGASS
ncbi:MAG: isopenicillin N synthase family oxygenase [Actinobacteria bacterium]|nr:isopenicillin N synthase family oxygenase [Actinomycetota bacterium]